MLTKHANDHRQFGKDGRDLEAAADIGELTPEINAELDRLTQGDMVLYEYAKRRFEESRPSFLSVLRNKTREALSRFSLTR